MTADARAPKRGLGMGLSALLGGGDGLGAAGAEPPRRVPIEFLRPSPLQPRRRFDEDELEILAQSIRERGVLQLVARGRRYPEIGAELGISAKTAENHVRNILGKLHLSRRSDLVRYAVEHGLD